MNVDNSDLKFCYQNILIYQMMQILVSLNQQALQATHIFSLDKWIKIAKFCMRNTLLQ